MFNLTPTVRNLLLANLAFFLAQTYFLPLLTQVGSLYPIGSPYFYPWQFFTYMFLHGGWGHLFSNMFGLISFGPMLEQRWGPSRFLTFWLICGVGAGVLYEGVRAYEMHQLESAYTEVVQGLDAANYDSFMKQSGLQQPSDEAAATALQHSPNDPALRQAILDHVNNIHRLITTSSRSGMLGASGALFGILFAFAYLFPNTELFLLFFPFPIKAKYFVFLYAAYELYSGVHRTPGDNVAHFAHLAGLLIGFIVLRFWERGRERFY
jgi:membrane associated rhomboid family serine protease